MLLIFFSQKATDPDPSSEEDEKTATDPSSEEEAKPEENTEAYGGFIQQAQLH